MGYASALAWVLFLIIVVVTALDLPHRALLGALRRGEVVSAAPRRARGADARHVAAPAAAGVRPLPRAGAASRRCSRCCRSTTSSTSRSRSRATSSTSRRTCCRSPIKVQNLLARVLRDGVDYPGNLFHYFGNSIMYAGLATLGCLITQSIVGYAFARLRFPGRNLLFGLTVAMLMMPFVVTLIPRFLLFRNLHLTDSLWPLIIPCWFGGTPYGIFLMRQFFMSIPRELDEAARIDGLGHWRILWRILIPQATPVLVALGILELAYFWNDLLGPLIYTETDAKMPITLGIFAKARTPYSYQLLALLLDHRPDGPADRARSSSPSSGSSGRASSSPGSAAARVEVAEVVLPDVRRSTTTRSSPCADLDLDGRGRRAARLRRPVGLRQVDGAADGRRASRRSPPARSCIGGRRVNDDSPEKRNIGDGLPELRALPAHDGAGEHGARAQDQDVAKRERATKVEQVAEMLGLERAAGPQAGASSRAASASASRWAGRSCATRASSCSTSRSRTSTRSCACRSAPRSRELQRTLAATTIFVTHDQVEAMTMADRVAVMRNGVLQQIGPPQELYERPVNLFVAELHRLAADELPRAGRSAAGNGGAAFVYGAGRGGVSAADRPAGRAPGRPAGDRRHPARSVSIAAGAGRAPEPARAGDPRRAARRRDDRPRSGLRARGGHRRGPGGDARRRRDGPGAVRARRREPLLPSSSRAGTRRARAWTSSSPSTRRRSRSSIPATGGRSADRARVVGEQCRVCRRRGRPGGARRTVHLARADPLAARARGDPGSTPTRISGRSAAMSRP